MIYTLTFSPSLDYIVRVDDFQLGEVNRTTYEEVLVGGKGLNVSMVLKNFGIETIALGFTAGFTGEQIKKGMESRGCQTDFITIDRGMSRINVKMKSNEESEINGQGPDIDDASLGKLFQKLDRIKADDVLVLAGSIPATLPEDIYEKIMKHLEEKQIRIVVDATKDLLVNVLKYKPFLIKPNNHELGEIFGVKLKEKEDIVFYARKLQEQGAKNVLISMAGDGAVFLSEDGNVYDSEAPKGKVVNSVGAGDSMVAGFLYGYFTKQDYQYAFKMGVATGSASAFSEKLATKSEAMELINKL